MMSPLRGFGISYHFPMRIGEYRQGCLLSRPPGTLSSTQRGGEGWGEEVLIGEATGYHLEMVSRTSVLQRFHP